MAAPIYQTRGTLLVSAGCVGLTVLSFLLTTHGSPGPTAISNTVISILAIGLATVLVLRSKAAGAAIREQADLLDLTHDTVFSRGMDDAITYWNGGAEDLYGWKRKEAVGRVAHHLLATIFPAPLDEVKAELLRTGRWEGELVHQKRDGTKVVVASRWSLQRDEKGRAAAILETNNDVTERKRTQECLDQAQANLERFNRVMLLGELTASIAHEINQPIAATVTNAGAGLRWLAAEPPGIENARVSLENIVKDGHRAGAVMNRIRALIKNVPPRRDRLDINEAILEVIALAHSELQKNRVKLQTRLSTNLPLVPADRVQLQQVMLNLMVNAIEAMSGVDDRPRELVVGSGKSESNDVYVDLRDSGPGLDPGSLERLFDSFYTTKREGMGMGLAISRRIVESHGGRIWATPNDPHGAVFGFTLPLDKVPPPSVTGT
jgi:PAS domain S-box-containing protein